MTLRLWSPPGNAEPQLGVENDGHPDSSVIVVGWAAMGCLLHTPSWGSVFPEGEALDHGQSLARWHNPAATGFCSM